MRTIQALLSVRSTGNAIRSRRAKTPAVMTFLEVPIAGDDTRFSERPIRIAPPPAPEGARCARRFWPDRPGARA